MGMTKVFGLLAGVGLLLAGCQSPYYSKTLVDIPTYPELTRTYDTSARIAVYPGHGAEADLTERLVKAGYTVLDDTANYQADYRGPDRIVELSHFSTMRLYYRDETYLYARFIVLVRGPFRHVDGQPRPLLTMGQRYFQVHARKNFGDNEEITQADYRTVFSEAYDNLMRNAAFREALEVK